MFFAALCTISSLLARGRARALARSCMRTRTKQMQLDEVPAALIATETIRVWLSCNMNLFGLISVFVFLPSTYEQGMICSQHPGITIGLQLANSVCVCNFFRIEGRTESKFSGFATTK